MPKLNPNLDAQAGDKEARWPRVARMASRACLPPRPELFSAARTKVRMPVRMRVKVKGEVDGEDEVKVEVKDEDDGEDGGEDGE